jgi:23S rRNA pseudouridine1911/1915/1917 synthase
MPEFRRHAVDLPPESAGLRLDQALARALPQYSRSRLQAWITAGAVRVEGRPARARDAVLGGERVIVEAELEADTRTAAQPMALPIVHEERSFLVIDKPPGLVVHPGAGHRTSTLQNGLLAWDPRLASVPRAGIVHRLDKETSGLMVVARTPEAHAVLVAALTAREVTREYLALCLGVLSGGGTVDAPIGRHRTQRTRMAVRHDGREAITHYRIEERFRAHTLLRVSLETGRTHQIRVHLAHAGFPIVGDPVYGGRRRRPAGATIELLAALERCPRQALHAARLSFAHPVSRRPVSFESSVPDDLAALLTALRRDRGSPR